MIIIFVNNTRPGFRMICPMCGDVRVASISQLVAHIRLTHSDDPGLAMGLWLQKSQHETPDAIQLPTSPP